MLVLAALVRPASAQEEAHSLAEAEWEAGSSGVAPAAEPTPERDVEPGTSDRVVATGASIVPGVLVHGSGHFVLGKPKTGARLAAMEGVGLVLAVGGIVVLAATGASRYTVGPTAAVVIGGAGLFGVSWLADVYGSSVADGARGDPSRVPAVFETELGHRYVYDPQFRYRHFLVSSFDARIWRLRLSPSAWFALDDENTRYRLAAAYRFAGPRPGAEGADGSFLDLELAATQHTYESDGFRTVTGEAFVGGRYDLERYDRELRGAFMEMGVGFGLQAFDYDAPGLELGEDVEQLLLARFAFGAYIGDPDRVGGEARFFYDHRHDDYAAGLKLTGLGSGVPGHFGVDTRFWFSDHWGARAEAMVGSAWIGGLSILFRQGAL